MSKRAILAVTLYITEDFPEDYDDHTILFAAEENRCISNHVLAEAKRIESKPGACNVCGRANVRVLDIDGQPIDSLTDADKHAIAYIRMHGVT